MANEKKAETAKIGMVDIAFLVNQTPSVLALRQEQQSKAANLQQWINAVNVQIAGAPSDQDKAALTQKYQTELNQRQQAIQAEYVKKVQQIDTELSQLIAEVAKKEKLDYVFAKGTVVFGATDITEKVTALVKK